MKLFTIVMVLIVSAQLALSATLEPPWKPVYKKPGYEFWYNPSTVKYFGGIIDVDVWEVEPDRASQKHIRFDRKTGQVAIATAKGYKYGKLVADFDFSKNGYVYGRTGKEYKSLYKILNRTR